MRNSPKKRRQLDKVCAYCEKAAPLQDGDHMLCGRFGVVCGGHSCRHFSYDPLKRIPVPRKPIDPEDGLPDLP